MNRLSGKVAIVTGGASGIGAATVRAFVSEGAQVISTDVQKEAGEKIAAQAGAMFLEHDVSDTQSWNSVEEVVKSRFGRLDVMFNNAGVAPLMDIEEVTYEKWNWVMGINLTGVMLGCQSAIRLMKANPDGSGASIINTSSTSAFVGIAQDAAYTASKGAVLSLTRSVAVHCARRYNIRCNALIPGSTRSGMTQSYLVEDGEAAKMFKNMSPMGRVAEAEELARMAVFLASDEASFCTGAEFKVDGGLLAAHPGL